MSTKKANVGQMLHQLSASVQIEFGGRVHVYNCQGDFTHTKAALEAQGLTDTSREIERLQQEAQERLSLSTPPSCDCGLMMAAIGLKPGSITHVQPLGSRQETVHPQNPHLTMGYTIGAGQVVIDN